MPKNGASAAFKLYSPVADHDKSLSHGKAERRVTYYLGDDCTLKLYFKLL